jgi:hypothetical protein
LSGSLHISQIHLKDIRKVERHSLLWSRRNPWSNYGYTNVILINAESLKFTNLLVDTITSKNYFESNDIVVDEVKEFYTWVK